jgi:hypothetical protein
MALEFLLISPRFNSFLFSGTRKTLSVCVWGSVGGHKMHIYTAKMLTFHVRYRRYVLVTNEFHKFC